MDVARRLYEHDLAEMVRANKKAQEDITNDTTLSAGERADLLKRIRVNFEAEEKILESRFQKELAEIRSSINDPDIFRKNNAEIIKDLKKYYADRLGEMRIAIKDEARLQEEEARLQDEMSQRILLIRERQQREIVSNMTDYFRNIRNMSREFQSQDTGGVFVRVAEDIKKSLEITRDSIRSEDLQLLLDQH